MRKKAFLKDYFIKKMMKLKFKTGFKLTSNIAKLKNNSINGKYTLMLLFYY